MATQPRALDPLLTALESYPNNVRNRLTVHKPQPDPDSVWMHPGEPVFDRLANEIILRYCDDGLRGAVFVDPYADGPYLFHVALASVEQSVQRGADGATEANARLLDMRLVGLRQNADGAVEEWPVERLLLLKGAPGFAPGRERLAILASKLITDAEEFARDVVCEQLVQAQRQRIVADLPSRREHISRGYRFQEAELAALRNNLLSDARDGDATARLELEEVKARQRSLNAVRGRRWTNLGRSGQRPRRRSSDSRPTRRTQHSEPEIVEAVRIARGKGSMEVATSFEENRRGASRMFRDPEMARPRRPARLAGV